MKIRFLLLNAYAVGGTVRTVVNQANALADAGHDVEITSVHRDRPAPAFPAHPAVRLRTLVDATVPPSWLRRRGESRLAARPSELVPPDEVKYRRFDGLTDRRLVRHLRSLNGGVLVTTRPALTLLAARFAPPSVITVGQEHVPHRKHRPGLAREIDRWYPRLDALTTLTEADLATYARRLTGSDAHRNTYDLRPAGGAGRVRVAHIPNLLPAHNPERSSLDRPLIVSAGRLVKPKGFARLIEAFEPIAHNHPEWQLRIYGSGPDEDRLRRLIFDRHLYNHVFLMGTTPHLEAELAKASAFALASRHEGFGMVLAEAMSHGVPPVSFDCPVGPREIITGDEGILVPPGDTAGLTKALTSLVEHPELRREMGARAVVSAQRYAPAGIREQWEALFGELAAARG
ncbi:glycosyl transferase group 1 [Actinobacteria bacterium OK074]|nr:glycosyl transferase group 1 [Actinobacteria bacterium OK074]